MKIVKIPQVEKFDMPGIRAMHKKDNFIKWLSQSPDKFMADVEL